MPYCIYLRKSRADIQAEAHGEGDTLLRHEKALRETAKRMGLEISEIYREIVSGETISDRPEMRRLLSDISSGRWDGVLVMEIERLARGDTSDQGTVAKVFRFSDTLIITPSKTYNPSSESDEEYLEFGLFMSRREYKTTNRRLQYGRFASVKEGKYAGSKPPFGYLRQKIPDDKGYTLIPDEKTSHIIKHIFNSYISGQGSCVIASELNKNLAPSPCGKGWTSQNVLSVLKNPTYAGKVIWNRRQVKKNLKDGVITKSRPQNADYTVKEGLHEALIPQEIFDKAKEIRQSKKSIPKNQAKEVSNPLAGLIKCGVCSHSMVKKPKGNHLKRSTLLCPYGCGNISCGFEKIESAVLSCMCEMYSGREITKLDEDNNDGDFEKAELRRLSSELEGVKRSRDKICGFLESGIYSEETFKERDSILRQKLDCIEKNLTRLKAEKDKPQSEPLPNGIYDIALLDEEGRNACYKSLIERIVYRKSQRGEDSPISLTLYTKV